MAQLHPKFTLDFFNAAVVENADSALLYAAFLAKLSFVHELPLCLALGGSACEFASVTLN